ncbi:unnamed protein product [Lymnaea stagnalis]|uniref:Phospholipase A2 n=1 Tax=Lymnaea stagnalis TaxID=6523 RepID=A0AAV2HJE9_LYMST
MSSASLLCLLVAGASLVVASANDYETEGRHRTKRNVIQLCRVINRYTGRSCLNYNNYGCFCGLRSKGSSPVDGVDKCCREHDRCFASLKCRLLPFVTYSLDCSGKTCSCNGKKKTSCSYRSCRCDIQLGECLSWATYNREHKNHNTLRCR